MQSDEEEWRVIIDKFTSRWHFPNTIKAIDGKHIVLKAPANSDTVKEPCLRQIIIDLSWANRVIENAFGILANCFRCLQTIMYQTPDNAKNLVLTMVVLHNIMRT